jgi:hypothetical protein
MDFMMKRCKISQISKIYNPMVKKCTIEKFGQNNWPLSRKCQKVQKTPD